MLQQMDNDRSLGAYGVRTIATEHYGHNPMQSTEQQREPRVLVAGDNSRDLKLSEWFLAESGYLPLRVDSLDSMEDEQGRCVDIILFTCDSVTSETAVRINKLKESCLCPVLAILPLLEDDSSELLCSLQADEMIFKPLRIEELSHRLRRLSSQSKSTVPPNWRERTLDASGKGQLDQSEQRLSQENNCSFFINDREKCVEIKGRRLYLSPTEFSLFSLLASDAGRVFSREEIIAALWSGNRRYSANDVHQCIRHLRSKLEENPSRPRWIKTVPRFGYMLDANHAHS